MPRSESNAQLIEPRELIDRVREGRPPVLLDVRWSVSAGTDRPSYERAHLPGACFVDLEADLSGSPGAEGRHPLPEKSAFELAMRKAGVSNNVDVVVYDESDSTACARLWWLLRHFGHDRVRVLNGGLRGWLAAKGHTADGSTHAKPGDFSARPGGLRALNAEQAALVARGGVLLDARAFTRYSGEHEPVDAVGGHIPGAISAPTAENCDAAGFFLPAEVLRDRFVKLGVNRTEVGTYCGSGITGAHQVLAAAVAGIDVALFAGSWSNWIADPTRPIAVGGAAG